MVFFADAFAGSDAMVSRPATATMVAIDDLSSFFILNFPPKESNSLAAKNHGMRSQSQANPFAVFKRNEPK